MGKTGIFGANSQCGKIIEFCKRRGSFTTMDCLGLGIASPRKRLSEIRRSPFYEVSSIPEEGAEGIQYNRYFIKEVTPIEARQEAHNAAEEAAGSEADDWYVRIPRWKCGWSIGTFPVCASGSGPEKEDSYGG